MSVKEKMTAIADAIRAKTGSTGKLTLDTMASAIAGMETGGGARGIYMAKITPASDVGELNVTHNLGTADILAAVCWAESFGGVTPAFDGSAANVYLKSGLPFRMSSASNHENMIAFAKWSVSNANVSTVNQPTSESYFSTPIDENTFRFNRAGAAAAKYFAGVTYTVIIMAASAFVGV